MSAAAIMRCHCNKCGRETDHSALYDVNSSVEHPAGDRSATITRLLQCGGCKECTTYTERHYFPATYDQDYETFLDGEYQPPRLWRKTPDWLPELAREDADLEGLLGEVYSAMNDSQVRLLSMGVRAALDHIMTKILGGDVGGFNAKLDAMVAGGHLTKKQMENLETVIEAGSASSHRGFRPPRPLLEEMVIVLEGIVREHYITGPMLMTARSLIPPRPKPIKNATP